MLKYIGTILVDSKRNTDYNYTYNSFNIKNIQYDKKMAILSKSSLQRASICMIYRLPAFAEHFKSVT